jgi:tetratricopeptide (TPR) repeat protein
MLNRHLRASLLWLGAAATCLAPARGQRIQGVFVGRILPVVHAEQTGYSKAEYNQYQEAAGEKDAQRRIVLLDAFVARYPNSTLMPDVLTYYYSTYRELKNYRKAFEYADELLMLGAPLGPENRLHTLYVRCEAFQYVFDPNAPDAQQQLTKNRYDALEAIDLSQRLPKPNDSTVSDADYAVSKRNFASTMLDIVADADLKLGDLPNAESELKRSLANNPADGWADYSLGVVYLKMTPPQVADGFWLLARAIPARPDAEVAIRKTLRNLIMAYQRSNCESATDHEMNDLVQLASRSAERPADFTIPSKLSPEQEQQCTTQPVAPTRPAASPVVAPVAKDTQESAPRRGLAPEEGLQAQPAMQPVGRYFALVIGINDYTYAPKLKTAVKDSEDVASLLRQQYGFETRVLTNATREQIIHALSDYRRTLKENANLLVYYAGHGFYDKDADKTYWLPADAEMHDTTNWIIADEITTDIKVIPARHILIISDSCYSGGITRSVDLAFTPQEQGRYLEKMMAGKSRTLMSSGGLEPVSDEGGGGHSVFAGALLRGLSAEEDTTFSAESLFEEFIRVSVAGQSEQTPQYNVIRNSGHDSGDFVFIRAHPKGTLQ